MNLSTRFSKFLTITSFSVSLQLVAISALAGGGGTINPGDLSSSERVACNQVQLKLGDANVRTLAILDVSKVVSVNPTSFQRLKTVVQLTTDRFFPSGAPQTITLDASLSGRTAQIQGGLSLEFAPKTSAPYFTGVVKNSSGIIIGQIAQCFLATM